jgi:ubiquinone biosynthesis protein Coq4
MKIRQALRSGARLMWEPLAFRPAVMFAEAVADTGILRASYERLASRLDPAVASHLAELQARPLDARALAASRPGSFGWAFGHFIVDNGLSVTAQVDIAPDLRRAFAECWPMARFVRVHDFHHTLLGVRADPVSEAGLQVFNGFNFHEPFGLASLVAFPIVARAYGVRATAAAYRRGAQLGRACPNLLWHPYEEWFDDDLATVRARVGIPAELVGQPW